MNLGLEGRTALVTGASRGIGLAIAEALTASGVRVVAAARTKPAASSPSADFVVADLGTPGGPAALVEAAVARLGGRLDILVNNVGGVHPRTGGFLTVTDDEWLETLTINFLAAVRTTRAALPYLLDRRGAVVTVGSVNASLPDPLVIDYSAAKAALVNFGKALSKEVGPRGVRVNTVSPGPVGTDLWLGAGGVAETVGAAGGLAPDEVARNAVAGTATGRFTRPEEVADLVLFLASDRAANVTGTDILIDGGLTTSL
ncbi:oxidoreductase [Actinoplanes sp. RD1]|uniref:oxidoreductase n=1 Tax=Actinoplanes sp. RD1 TaxID=3064538 RepID=UPI0027427502|nr:oxidoreductase [Actinoplanes sp. RD1]